MIVFLAIMLLKVRRYDCLSSHYVAQGKEIYMIMTWLSFLFSSGVNFDLTFLVSVDKAHWGNFKP